MNREQLPHQCESSTSQASALEGTRLFLQKSGTDPISPVCKTTKAVACGRRLLILKQACSRDWPESAICVQRFDDSLSSAIHITYRSSLRSSSMHEPRDPPLKVVFD
eukprot:Opistho-1_new@29932